LDVNSTPTLTLNQAQQDFHHSVNQDVLDDKRTCLDVRADHIFYTEEPKPETPHQDGHGTFETHKQVKMDG
jgi:hypothetical protein